MKLIKAPDEFLEKQVKAFDFSTMDPGEISKNMIDVMPSGSVIYDLAASQGGNAELTKVDEIIKYNSVNLIGEANILNKLPVSASNLYAKNMFNFVNNLFDNDKKIFEINLEDEIIEKTKVK